MRTSEARRIVSDVLRKGVPAPASLLGLPSGNCFRCGYHVVQGASCTWELYLFQPEARSCRHLATVLK